MPTKSLLELLLLPERQRRQPGSIPVMVERPVDEGREPLVSSNMRAQLVLVRRSPTRGVARLALFPCDLDQEPAYVASLCEQIWQLSEHNSWANRCTEISEAVTILHRNRLEPRTLLVSYEKLHEAYGQEVSPEEANKLMIAQGYIAEVDSIRIAVAPLPPRVALLATSPTLVGAFIRVDDHVGVMLQEADRTVVVVRDDS